MTLVLLATNTGCLVFAETGRCERELADRAVTALAADADGACLAVVDGHEIWRRSAAGEWSALGRADVGLESIVRHGADVFAGSAAGAIAVRLSRGQIEPVPGFGQVAGREAWFAEGPPLSVRSLTSTTDGGALLAAVHVGGIPRSIDHGVTWAPTLPITADVHEVRAHPTRPNLAVAAAAVGLCVSEDAGLTWTVIAEGLAMTYALAVAALQDEVLFSVQEGPFARRAQLWRWRISERRLEPVREGLPVWLDAKLDTGHLAASSGGVDHAALVDGGGNLWLSSAGGGWNRLATDAHAHAVLVL